MNADVWKIRIFFGLLFTFIVSTYFAYEELKYAIWGKTVSAQLLDVHNTRDIGGGGRSVAAIGVEYSFTDAERGARTEKDMVPTDWERPTGNEVLVEYIPGEKDASRIAGYRRVGSIVFFFGVLLVVGIFILKLAREANSQSADRRARRGSPDRAMTLLLPQDRL